MQYTSLYLHFPFCETRCHYCDFYSLASDRVKPADRSRFIQALRQEIEQSLDQIGTLKTVFLGGGTPSMTEPSDMAYLFEPLLKSQKLRLSEDLEWTMEANPSSVDLQKLQDYRRLGINRISFGVQSTHEKYLQSMGRVHDREAAFESIRNAQLAGFQNISADLLCGIPNQSLEELEISIDELLELPLQHLSCYLLTLAPHHPLYKDLPHEEDQLAHLLKIDEKMVGAGFEHYEISNFARPGWRAQHNLAYWKGTPYLGLGPSAHSFDGQKRFKNTSSLHRWSDLILKGESAIDFEEELTPEQKEIEGWMLALRLEEGFPKSWISHSKQGVVDQLKARFLLEDHPSEPDHFRLTPSGWPLSDQIAGEFIS